MVRVAMVVTNACAPDPRVLRHARWVMEAGHEVTVHAFDRLAEHPMSENHHGVRIMRYHLGKTPYGGTLRTYQGIRSFQRQVVRTLLHDPPALVYCHDADTLRVGVALQQQRSVPFVFDMHDLQHTWVRYQAPQSRLRAAVAGRMKRRMLNRAKHARVVVTSSGGISPTSRGFSEWLAHHGIESHVVENRPEPPFPSRPETESVGWTVGFVGRVRDQKAIDLLIKTVDSMQPHERPSIRIAGDGVAAASVRRHLMERVEAGELEAKVTGAFAQAELPDLLAEIDVMFAMYSPLRGNILQGALPVKMFDAAAYGVPSVVNQGCLMAEVALAEGIGCPAEWNDLTSVAKALFQARSMSVRLETTADRERRRWRKALLPVLDSLQ
jgi:glycosyltransferase involved in cell wall biosynthesis